MWDTETVRQTSPVVECQITDIHSVAHHQRLVQAAEHRASELTSSVAVLLATAVQIQRCGNILDFVLTSNSALISNVNTMSGMSDHEAVLFQINMNPMKTKLHLHTKCTIIKLQTGKLLNPTSFFLLKNTLTETPTI